MNDTYLLNPTSGKSIKLSLTNFDQWQSILGNDTTLSMQQVASLVGWVFIALNKRSQGLNEIPFSFMRDEAVVDYPFLFRDNGKVNWIFLLQKLDRGMQLYNEAYLIKQRNQGGRLIGFRYVAPYAIKPDTQRVNNEVGIEEYIYTTNKGEKRIPREDILIFPNIGINEKVGGTSAAMATRLAAEILRSIGEAADTIFDNNAIPPIVVQVPTATQTQDVKRIESRFRRFFNRGRGSTERQVAGVREGVEFDTLDINLKDMQMSELKDANIKEVLAAHDVPESIALANAANYATDLNASRRFISTLGARHQFIADIINEDEEVMTAGVDIKVQVREHYTQRRDEETASTAFQRYLSGMYPKAAGWLLGIKEEDFPEEIRQEGVFLPAVSVIPSAPMAEPEGVEDAAGEDMKSIEYRTFDNFIKKGTHRKRQFKSDVLTLKEIEAHLAKRGVLHEYPFILSY